MVDETEVAHPISWTRAIVTGLVIAVVGFLALVYGPNAVLTKLHGKTHGSLVFFATAIFFVALFALAAVLRWLQRRKLI